jgi:SAM-dependent methyltransferase
VLRSVAALGDLVRPDRYPRSAGYDPAWVVGLDMGPHPLWQLEDLTADLDLRPGMRVLDLGSGRGATSVYLAREHGVEVVAADWWVPAEDAAEVFARAGVSDRVTAVHAEAHALPFEAATFDAVVSIDAFEYFGTDVHLLPDLLRVLRPGGTIGMTTPALGVDPYEQAPPEAVTELIGWEAAAWHSPDWWRRHWELSGLVTEVTAHLQSGGRQDWISWARAAGEADDGPLLTMLSSLTDDQIGFALVSALKR